MASKRERWNRRLANSLSGPTGASGGFRNSQPIKRSSMNSWDDENFVAAIQRTGRKKIVLAGIVEEQTDWKRRPICR